MLRLAGLTLATLLAMSSNGQSPADSHPIADAKRETIEELFKLTQVDKILEQSMRQMQQIAQNGAEQAWKTQSGNSGTPAPAELGELNRLIFDFLARRMSWDVVKERYIVLYDETFTLEELQGQVMFYKTPAGRAFMAKVPIIAQKSMRLGQDIALSGQPELQALVQDFMRKLQARPATPGKL